MKAERAYVALGSNLGDRAATLDAAVAALRGTPGVTVLAVSRYHETPPVGGPEGQPQFLNGALALDTALSPRELIRILLSIEARLGRDRAREVRWGPRRLDLDLLLFGEERLDDDALTLPHPRMEERLFVLEPLAEIAPGLPLPGCGTTVERRIEKLSGKARTGREEYV